MAMRNCSSSWSVYDGEWDSPSQKHFAPLTSAFPLQSLKDCGVKKFELICRGAQGAVYKARNTRCDFANSRCCANNQVAENASLLDECNEQVHENENVTEVSNAVCAVKRIFTQQNDFGRRGVADTVLREVTLLKYVNQLQYNFLTTGLHDNTSTLTIHEPAKVVVLHRVVEAPHRELCMVMELCVLDLRRVFILHRSAQSMYSPNYNKTSSATLETVNFNPVVAAQTCNAVINDTNEYESCHSSKYDVPTHKEKNKIDVDTLDTANTSNNNNYVNNKNNKGNMRSETVLEGVHTSLNADECAEEVSSSLHPPPPLTHTSFLSQLPLIRYLFRRICRVVYFLHKYCNVIHRDLKLSNILVTNEHELRLSDFGSARFINTAALTKEDCQCNRKNLCIKEDRETLHDTKTLDFANNKCNCSIEQVTNKSINNLMTPSSMRTTLLYQSPESLLGEAIVPTALDVWSLGVILAELILQKHLFHANSELAMISAIWKLLGNNNSLSSTPEPMPSSLNEQQPEQSDIIEIHTLTTPSDEEGRTKEEAQDKKNPDVVNNVLDKTKEASCGTLNLKFPTSLLPECGLDLLRRMLCLDPLERITLYDVLQHPFLHFDGEDDDDKVGQSMWHEKINTMLQEEDTSKKVQMPMLNLTEEDESEGNGSEANDVSEFCYNNAYRCATNNNDDGNDCSDDDSYELELPQIHLHLSRKEEEEKEFRRLLIHLLLEEKQSDLQREKENSVRRKSSPDEIKSAYKRLALLTHPDKCNGSQDRFLEVRKAYEVLSDTELRKEYDNILLRERNKLAGFVRPLPLQSVVRPIQFALADNTLYTFETATHLLRCGMEHGDVIMFNKQVGYFLGLAGDDYLYWCRTSEQHATQLCHRDSTFALSSIQVIQRNYMHAAHHTRSNFNFDLHHKSTNNTNTKYSNGNSNAHHNSQSTSSGNNCAESSSCMRSSEPLQTETEKETTRSTATSNRATAMRKKEIRELERIRQRIRERERCRQITEMLTRLPNEEEQERIRICKDMRVGIASLRNMYKCVCKKESEYHRHEHDRAEELVYEQNRESNQNDTVTKHRQTPVQDDVTEEIRCRECEYVTEETQTQQTECCHEENYATPKSKSNLEGSIHDVNGVENLIATRENVNEEEYCTNNISNGVNNNYDDEEEDDDELFIVHENIISETLLKSHSTNISEGETDLADNDFYENDNCELHEHFCESPSLSKHAEGDNEYNKIDDLNLRNYHNSAYHHDEEENEHDDDETDNYSYEDEDENDDEDDDDDDDDDESIQIDIIIEDLYLPKDNQNNYKMNYIEETEQEKEVQIDHESATISDSSQNDNVIINNITEFVVGSKPNDALRCNEEKLLADRNTLLCNNATAKSDDELHIQNEFETKPKVININSISDEIECTTWHSLNRITESCLENVLPTKISTQVDEVHFDSDEFKTCKLPAIRKNIINGTFIKSCNTKEDIASENESKNNRNSVNMRAIDQNADKKYSPTHFCHSHRRRPLMHDKQTRDECTQELFAILQRDNKTTVAARKEIDKQSADELFAQELEFMQAFARKRRPTTKYAAKC